MANKYSVLPPTGAFPKTWFDQITVPQGQGGILSAGGWTLGNEGVIQQTFLGASIRSFTINAGFGNSTSSLSVSLVEDEYNTSDGTGYGKGMDAYHNGKNDLFRPPAVGSPVWFTFGGNPASVEQAFQKTFDDTYAVKTIDPPDLNFTTNIFSHAQLEAVGIPQYNYVDMEKSTYDKTYTLVDKSSLYDETNASRGYYHLVFGGILQSVSENTSTDGKCLYSVTVVDPREILSNCVVVLNSWQGETLGIDNIFNVYGFLEYDLQKELVELLDKKSVVKSTLIRKVDEFGNVLYTGNPEEDLLDVYEFGKNNGEEDGEAAPMDDGELTSELILEGMENPLPRYFPITGQGFSRRSDAGIPWYRVRQGLETLFEYYGDLPQEYVKASPDGYSETGFGQRVNFRGFEYVVDLGGLPLDRIPLSYNLEFDQIDLLSLAQEICDITSHELFVTLLPIIARPENPDNQSLNKLDEKNKKIAAQNQGLDPEDQDWSGFTAGIIRIDSIDKTKQPEYGAIINYISDLKDAGKEVLNQDVGLELSNVATDKVVVGAQEVNMHFFHNNRDRDELWVRKNEQEYLEEMQEEQWLLETSLKQQILPFYGFLGDDKAVTIPKGWGSYQQILLDARDLNAFGVGNYYIATEIELRSALVSFEQWKNFLLKYNDVYISDISPYQATFAALGDSEDGGDQINDVLNGFKNNTGLTEDSPLGKEILAQFNNREFGVVVPRSVWNSDRSFVRTDNNLPASPCSPPYGYPLYYKRAEAIGIPEAGLIRVFDKLQQVRTNYNKLAGDTSDFGSHSSEIAETLAGEIALLQERLDQIKRDYEVAKPIVGKVEVYTDPEFISYSAALLKAQAIYDEYQAVEKKIREEGKQLLTVTQGVLKNLPNSVLAANRSHFAAKHLENAKKVYQFVKKVAEENLGKKYLVKIPKATNLRYQPEVSIYKEGENYNEAKDVAAGPFGFMPRAYPAIEELDIPVDIDPTTGSADFESTWAESIALTYPQIDPTELEKLDGTEKFEHYLQIGIDYYKKTGDDVGNKYVIDEDIENDNNFGTSFENGALRNNYNPVAERWDFNYKPEPLGGWLPFELFQEKNLDFYNDWSEKTDEAFITNPYDQLPQATRDGLAPRFMNNLISQDGRVYCYVKFNNSHLLDLSLVPKDNMTQQYTKDGGLSWTPDVATILPNTRLDQKLELKQEDIENKFKEEAGTKNEAKIEQNTSVAFVKCEIDERFYMPPKIRKVETPVFASEYQLSLSNLPITIEKTNDDGCPTYDIKVNKMEPVFTIAENGGVLENAEKVSIDDFVRQPLKKVKNKRDLELPPGEEEVADISVIPLIGTAASIEKTPDQIIDSKDKFLDSNHVYALITVPGRIKSTVDQRWIDGPMQAFNTADIKNLFTQDVVKIDNFKRPMFPEFNSKEVDCEELGANITLTEQTLAQRVQQKALIGYRLGEGRTSIINYIQPSPVYPDMVALPLMSWERCYGPWFSAAVKQKDNQDRKVRYFNIGGQVEVIKDESLAPWAYGGYKLLDAAGTLRSEFSNSLLLISERGGISYIGAPTGVSLGQELKNRGPLVTSISVNIGDSITTSVNLDLYTAKYGKLQKAKDDAISKIARERQKISDQNNNAIRRGLGKSQTSMNLMGEIMANGGQQIVNLANTQQTFFTEAEQGRGRALLLTNDGITPKDVYDRGLETQATFAAQVAAYGGMVANVIPTNEMFEVFNFVQPNTLPNNSNAVATTGTSISAPPADTRWWFPSPGLVDLEIGVQ